MKTNVQVPGGNQPLPGGGPGGPLARFLKRNSVQKDLLLMSTCLFSNTMIFSERNSNEELMIHPCRGVQGEVPSGQYLSLSCRFDISKIFKKKILKITISCIETSKTFLYFFYHIFLGHRAGYSMKCSAYLTLHL